MNHKDPPRDVDDDLPALRAPATGRRSDDAFVRAVKADVDAARGRGVRALFVGVPAVAVSAAAVVVAVHAASPEDDRAAIRAAVVAAADDGIDLGAFDDDVLAAASADEIDADVGGVLSEFGGDDFAIPGLAGSSDQELAAIEAALDDALAG